MASEAPTIHDEYPDLEPKLYSGIIMGAIMTKLMQKGLLDIHDLADVSREVVRMSDQVVASQRAASQ